MELVLLGLSLGFAAGVSPGPLLALMVAASLERGFGAGARFALAPLVSDAPVVVLALVVLRELPDAFLRVLSIGGGGFVIWLGVETVRKAIADERPAEAEPGQLGDLWRGVLVNLLNPNPWLFWAAVGGPILIEAWRVEPLGGVAFLATFYLLLEWEACSPSPGASPAGGTA